MNTPERGTPAELRRLLEDAAGGRPPVADGRVTVVPGEADELAAVLAFTGHHVVVGDLDPGWVGSHLAAGDTSGPVGPTFVAAVAERLGRTFDNLDLVLAATAAPLAPGQDLPLVPTELDPGHPRVERSLRYRRDLRCWTTADGGGLLLVGRGLAGRWEAAFEVAPEARGRGLGRLLAASARHVVPAGEHVVVQVAPGHAASLRAILAVGAYRPIGAEILFPPTVSASRTPDADEAPAG